MPVDKNYFIKYKNVRLEAKIMFLSEYGDNPGVSFITYSSIDARTEKMYDKIQVISQENPTCKYDSCVFIDELCLEFCFPFNGSAHPWIPALEFMHGIVQRSSFLDVEEFYNIPKRKALNKEYKLSAFAFGNQARFTIEKDNYKGSSCLFEAIIEPKLK